MSRKILTTIVLVGVFSMSVFAAAADDKPATILIETEDYGAVLAINDGRLNGVDVAAPVAVYYTYETALDADGSPVTVPDGIDLLGVASESNNGYLIAHVSEADLIQIMTGTVNSLVADGYALHYSADSNWFWLTAPADSEGKVYTFQWENLSFPLAQ